LEQLESIPWNNYALLSTSLPRQQGSSSVDCPPGLSSGKRRMSKAERKRSKTTAATPPLWSSPPAEHSNLTPTSSACVLSVIVQKVKGEEQEAIYELKTPRETVESYRDYLDRLSSSSSY
jgi:hypothetical protein